MIALGAGFVRKTFLGAGQLFEFAIKLLSLRTGSPR